MTVVPKAIETNSVSRAQSQYDFHIDIGIQKKIGPEVDTDLPPLMTLVEEIVDYLDRRKLTAFPAAIWIKTQNVPIYDPQHLVNDRVFTSLLTVTYRAVR